MLTLYAYVSCWSDSPYRVAGQGLRVVQGHGDPDPDDGLARGAASCPVADTCVAGPGRMDKHNPETRGPSHA